MSVMYIRNEQTGEFEPVPSLVGPQGPPGSNGDGAGTVTAVNNVAPDATGNVTLTAADVGARPDNWMPTAADVGALGKNETAVNATQLNGKSAEYYKQPRKLLDNGWFGGALVNGVKKGLINQRGYVSGTDGLNDYCIERWKLSVSTALILNSGYNTLTGHYDIMQIVSEPLIAGVTYTLAAKMRASGGTRTLWLVADDSTGTRIANAIKENGGEWETLVCSFTPNADISGLRVYVTNASDANVQTDIVWIDLYEGEYTADNLPPYVPKGYAAELAACNAAPVDLGGGYGGGSLQAYPVGSIYLSVNETSPASLFGGTWEQLKDRFLLGAGDSYALGGTGGKAEHTLTDDNIPTLGIAYKSSSSSGTGSNYVLDGSVLLVSERSDEWGAVNTETTHEPVPTMPPYLAVYMWKRVS